MLCAYKRIYTTPFGSSLFLGAQIGHTLSFLSLTLLPCSVPHCSVVCVKNLVFRDGRLKRAYSGMKGDSIGLSKTFEFSSRFGMNFAGICVVIRGCFDNLCGCTRHILKCGTISNLYLYSVLNNVEMDLINGATPLLFTLAVSILFPVC